MKKILLSLVVCAAFCACSNDDVVVSNSATPVIDGDGYVSLAINLPTTGSTRANDVYDDGLESEYAVNDATLLLFAGNDESSAVYYAPYNLTPNFKLYESTTDNITSRCQITQQISTATDENGNALNIYALVVLNKNGLLTDAVLSGATLSSLQSTIQELGGVDAMTGTGFYMCNAPLIDAKGGSSDPSEGTVTTLAKIDSKSIYSTAAEAEAHAATEIYVERGMAKVTVLDNAGSTIVGTEIPVVIDGFVLDLTNNVSYLVRNTTGSESWWDYSNGYSPNYRMAGNVEVAADLYRTYWAVDPNYSSAPYISGDEGARNYGDVMTSLAGTSPTLTAVGAANPLYCLENTFNVAHQNQDETTRAIIGATLYEGKDFYIWDNDKTVAYLDDDDLEAEGATTGLEKIKALILTQMKAEGYMEEAEAVWVGPSDEEKEEDPDLSSNLYDYITIVFDDEEDLAASDDLTFTYEVSTDVVADWFVNPDNRTQPLGYVPAALVEGSDEYNEIVADLNDHHQVAYYEGGESYYPVLIKHFGDDLTYWNIEDVKGVSYPDGIYNDTAEESWLGRYGVLRNNWYEINVTGVNTIGSATVPTAYGDPDDPVESWISIEINILSWAKRTQDVTL